MICSGGEENSGLTTADAAGVDAFSSCRSSLSGVRSCCCCCCCCDDVDVDDEEDVAAGIEYGAFRCW
jgi:hypothetical protein